MGWSDRENAVVVREYFAMLERASRNEDVRSKQPVYERAASELGTRDIKGVAAKFYNISAILKLMGWKTVPGLSPWANYQEPLAQAVRAFVRAHPALLSILEPARAELPSLESIQAFATAEAEVGDYTQGAADAPRPTLGEKERIVVTQLFDLTSGSRAREIGDLGEGFIFELEQRLLWDAGRRDLAKQVEWTARDVGDGRGYDIKSFTPTGSTKYIEVKSTLHPEVDRPFIISAPEVEASKLHAESYRLSRVFDLLGRPRVKTLVGPVPEGILWPRSFWGRLS